MDTKNENQQLLDETMPIFETRCKNSSNKCKLVYTGCAKQGQPIGDCSIDFNTTKEMEEKLGKNAYDIGEYSKYNIIAKMMSCSITGGFLAKFDTLPCYYMTLLYTSKFGTRGTIVTVCLNFNIDTKQLERLTVGYTEKKKQQKLDKKNKKINDSKVSLTNEKEITTSDNSDKNISTNENNTAEKKKISLDDIKKREIEIDLKKLIGIDLDGSYNISLSYDKEEKDEFLSKMKEKLASTENEHKEFAEYVKLFTPVMLESYTSKNIIIHNKLLKYLKNTKFMDFVRFVLDKRMVDRSTSMNTYFDQKIPKTIFNYRELKDNPDLIDKMIDDDDRSSNQSSDDELDELDKINDVLLDKDNNEEVSHNEKEQ